MEAVWGQKQQEEEQQERQEQQQQQHERAKQGSIKTWPCMRGPRALRALPRLVPTRVQIGVPVGQSSSSSSSSNHHGRRVPTRAAA